MIYDFIMQIETSFSKMTADGSGYTWNQIENYCSIQCLALEQCMDRMGKILGVDMSGVYSGRLNIVQWHKYAETHCLSRIMDIQRICQGPDVVPWKPILMKKNCRNPLEYPLVSGCPMPYGI